jgi:hypothetical protein
MEVEHGPEQDDGLRLTEDDSRRVLLGNGPVNTSRLNTRTQQYNY